MQNGYVESFNGRMRDKLLYESLFFGLDHARSASAEWGDFNTARPIPPSATRHRQLSPEPSPQPAPTLRLVGATRLRRLLNPRPMAQQKLI